MEPPSRQNRSPKDYLVLSLKGFCMGASDVVPGVSGGTMALILGIYEELIQAVRSVDLAFFRRLSRLRIRDALNGLAWPFLLAVGGGILLAVVTMARGIAWALIFYPVCIWSFFFGLVLASVWSVGRHVDHWNLGMTIWVGLGAVGSYWLVGLVPVVTPETSWFVFVSGAIAICAMILPGISGSFILVLLGKYQYVLDAVNHRDVLTLFIFAMGTATGLLCFVRLLSWFLNRYHDLTLATLIGLMLGSLRKIWPWKVDGEGVTGGNVLPGQFDADAAVALGLMITGFVVVLGMNAIARRRK